MIRILLKSSVAWSFAATGLRLGGFLLVLPFLVRTLDSEELGLWYLFVSMGALGGLIELGFATSGSRAASYFWGGAALLQKFGTPINENREGPNYQGLSDLVATLRIYYLFIAALLFILQASIGTVWVQHVAEGYSSLGNVLVAWLVYCAGLSFNMSAALWPGMLIGIQKVALSQRIVFLAIASNYATTIVLLLWNVGIFAPIIGTILQAMIIQRVSEFAFRREVSMQAPNHSGLPSWQIMKNLWPMSWRTATIGFGAYLITQANTMISASVLGLADTASYGLSLQLANALLGISAIWVTVKLPLFNSLRVAGDHWTLSRIFITRIRLSIITFIIGATCLVLFGPSALGWIGAKTEILPAPMLIALLWFCFLEMHHAQHAQIVLTENRNPFVIPALVSGGSVVGLSLLLTPHLGIWGMLLSFGITQMAFNNWWTVLRGLKGLGISPRTYFNMLLGRADRSQLFNTDSTHSGN